MPVIAIFNGTFCNEDNLINKIAQQTNYNKITDGDIIKKASVISDMPESRIKTAFSSKASVFNKFTHEKERSLAWVKLALAEMLLEKELLIHGFSSLLIPKEIMHVLRICLIADMKYRIARAGKESNLSKKQAVNMIHEQDEQRARWVYSIYNLKDPWEASLYDIVIPTDKMDIEQILTLIQKNLRSEVIKDTEYSEKATNDFVLAAQVNVALAKEGHSIGVIARDGCVTLTINKHVLMLSRLEEELKSIVLKVPGVKSIETRVGKGYHQADIYRKYDFSLPKILLVDDEREFVQTLSERLLIRNMESTVVYDGESALDLINEDEPDVMILDLKMPGVDGIEVFRRVKQTKPEIEVIILTGHGGEEDRKLCMKLGAFEYLRKPVNIELLSETLKKAKQKMTKNQQQRKDNI